MDVKSFKGKVEYILTDIDDTITDEGQLHAEAYTALWNLKGAGKKIIPVTGRPAGWCEMIARFWPAVAVVGENGAFYFRYHNKKMHRVFNLDEASQEKNRLRLEEVKKKILAAVPAAQVASDQFCRWADLAIDFAEDVGPLPAKDIEKIRQIFVSEGAQAKVSSIHVNGWFGSYDKVTMAQKLLKTEFGLTDSQIQEKCLFVGDSPNDEPMFQFFKNSFGVANIKNFESQLKYKPAYTAQSRGGAGFCEIAKVVIQNG